MAYTKKPKHTESDIPTPEVVEEVSEVIVEPVEPEKTYGKVTNCEKLNVRSASDIKSTSICIITKSNKVEIDTEASTKDWFKVTTETGIEGFCMKKYISIETK